MQVCRRFCQTTVDYTVSDADIPHIAREFMMNHRAKAEMFGKPLVMFTSGADIYFALDQHWQNASRILSKIKDFVNNRPEEFNAKVHGNRIIWSRILAHLRKCG